LRQINKRPIKLLRRARSWLGHHRPRLRNKPPKPLKPLPPLASSSSSSMSGDNDADSQCRIGPIEPDIPDTHTVAGDEDTEVFLRTVFCEACSILAPVAEGQGRTVDDLTGEEVQQAVVKAYYQCTAGDISSSPTFSQASNTAPAGSNNRQGQGQGLKRARSGERGDGDGDGDDSPGRGRKRQPSSASSQKRGPNLQWLCPFYLSDQEAHRQCLRFKLSRIVDVRIHILRKHLQQSHCPRCGHTIAGYYTRLRHIDFCRRSASAMTIPSGLALVSHHFAFSIL
jgi:hypothetical protein